MLVNTCPDLQGLQETGGLGNRVRRCLMAQENVTQAGESSRGESGQSIILLTAAFVALLLIVGLAIDLGMVYIERIRLSRACDAAALAAASELPLEEEAQRRAIVSWGRSL